MSISKDQVLHIAALSRLKLTENETGEFTAQLNDILQFAEKLNQLDTTNVAPTSHALAMTNVLREDAVQPSLSREQALANAPADQDGMFMVPAVFQE